MEERFMEKQGTLVGIIDTVEVKVFASRHRQTLCRAPALIQVLYSVRCVRAALSCVRVGRLTQLARHHRHHKQLTWKQNLS